MQALALEGDQVALGRVVEALEVDDGTDRLEPLQGLEVGLESTIARRLVHCPFLGLDQ